MSVVALVRDAEDVAIVPWARRIAAGRELPLTVVYVARGSTDIRQDVDMDALDDHPVLTPLRAALLTFDRGQVSVRRVTGERQEHLVAAELARLEPELLVAPVGPDAEDAALSATLQAVAAEVLLLRAGVTTPSREGGAVLVATAGGPHARAALQLARALARAGVRVTALHVGRPAATEEQARRGALDVLSDALRSAAWDGEGPELRVSISARPAEVIASLGGDFDLVLVGASERGPIQRLLSGSVPGQLLQGRGAVGISLTASPTPLPLRALRRWFPQLDREERLDLATRLESGSRWSFDFMALLALSTSIAAIGLMQSSTAVVIGAMLVAPLMTPLLGAGLAIAQGNPVLARTAAVAMTRGTVLALAVSWVLGIAGPDLTLTAELAARGSPTPADLVVALFSGTAGALAAGRRELSAALPGVAIAVALVPPVATVGVAGAIGAMDVARGAALLFATNLVAIVLAAALVFRLMGVRGERAKGRSRPWVRSTVLVLLGVASALLVPLSATVATRLVRAGPAVKEDSLQPRLVRSVRELVEAEPAVSLVTVTPSREQVLVVVLLDSGAARDVAARLERALVPLFETRALRPRVVTLPSARAEDRDRR